MPEIDNAVRELIRAYLYDPAADREAILGDLPEGVGKPAALLHSCLQRAHERREAGVHFGESFEMPHLQARYPDEELNFLVPESYDPATPTGLMVLLHGGGSGSPRDAGRDWLQSGDGGYHFHDTLAEMPCITVAPGNLQLETHKRWSNPTSDAYVLGVIEEACCRYNIDPDRVCIGGQSMGGFGAFHIVQTLGDRFATVGCHAGAWYWGFWEGMRGTDFYLMQGINDFIPGERPRFTEVAFARMASACLSGFHIPHTYDEHQGTHSFTDPPARESFLGFLDHARDRRREAFPTEIATCSHKGAFRLYDSPHWFWLSVGRTHYGTFEIDHLEPTESLPSYCTTDFRHYTARVPGGMVHATNEGDNCIAIRAHNVDELTVWLNGKMVDFVRPVRVTINGEVVHDDVPQPSLKTLLQSFDRRRDPGMLFPARLDFDLKKNDWELQKQFVPIQPTE